MTEVAAVGVGPGSPECLTGEAAAAIRGCDVVVGYGYTLKTIEGLTAGKEVREITMGDQEEAYRELAAGPRGRRVVVPFTGDVSFSESEVVDRLAEIFGRVRLVPGISAVQVAAARAAVPLDKCRVITMHVSGPIEEKKRDMLAAVSGGTCVILVPRPWPRDPEKNFMPSEAAAYLREAGAPVGGLRARVYERLTTADEACTDCAVGDLEGREFSDMCVVVIGEVEPESYAGTGRPA